MVLQFEIIILSVVVLFKYIKTPVASRRHFLNQLWKIILEGDI